MTRNAKTRSPSGASDKIRAATSKIRQTGGSAAKAAGEAYASARERTSEAVTKNPLAAVIGGIALGAVIGALIPRIRGEKALFGKAGAKLGDSARKVADAGREKLDELGISRDAASSKVGDLLDKAASAISTRGKASAAAKSKAKPRSKAKA